MANKRETRHLKYNIVVMGDPYCGKSSIIERYTTGKYGPNYIQTIGNYINIYSLGKVIVARKSEIYLL